MPKDEKTISQTGLQFTVLNPVGTVEQLLECVNVLDGAITPEQLLSVSGLSNDVEKFFDLLRASRDAGLLVVPLGAHQMIRRAENAN